MQTHVDQATGSASRSVAHAVALGAQEGAFSPLSHEQPKAVAQAKFNGGAVAQLMKTRSMADNNDEIEIDSDLEDNDAATTRVKKSLFKVPQKPKKGQKHKKPSRQEERVFELRKQLRAISRRSGGKSYVKSIKFQKILAGLNKRYSPQNTTAIGIRPQGNMVATKMGGANANYLERVLNATLLVDEARSAKGKNTHHAEKVLSQNRGASIFSQMIIDKNRCSVCGKDDQITNSAKMILD